MSPDRKPNYIISNIQIIEGVLPEVNESSEEILIGLLDLTSTLDLRPLTIEYVPAGCEIKETISTESLKKDPTDTPEDRRLFLSQKAHDLQAGIITFAGPTEVYELLREE